MQASLSETFGRPIPTVQIVDVGAMSTGEDRYQSLVTAGIAQVVGFEPNPAEHARLSERTGPYRYLPLALGNGDRATFHHTRYPGCSSLLAPNASVIDLFMTIGCADPGGNFHVIGTDTIETTRLDDVRPKVEADYLKIDIQGYELEVMQHATATLANTLVIECEVEFVPMYRDQPLFGDIQCFLREQGFVLHKFIDVGGRTFRPLQMPNPYLPISQLLWADAIFVRDFSRLNTYTDDGLLKAAAILDLVYSSFDLVLLLLGEYDRRQQTDLRQRYREAMRQHMLVPKFMNIMDRPN